MKTIYMTIEEARNFMVSYHKINISDKPIGKQGLFEVFDQIASIQYDPLNVVGRNSDLVLQARIKDYKPSLLEEALYKDRTLVDAWDKMMGIYQIKDYPYFALVREKKGEEAIHTLRHRLTLEALDYVDEIIEYIEANGAVYSSELNLGEVRKHKWGHTKPSSATLDYLFHVGKLGIRSRKNTSKQYDLIENLFPPEYLVDYPFDSEKEFIKWYLLRRISSMGLVSLKSGVTWSGVHLSGKLNRVKYIKDLCEEELVTKVVVEGINEDLYCLTESLLVKEEIKKKISFIAPLDNLIWDRNLIKKLFNFEYTWEVYTPIVKRKYGYYVLPILYGSDFIGRIEFEMHRNHDDLVVKNIWWENKIEQTLMIKKRLDKAILSFREYLVK